MTLVSSRVSNCSLTAAEPRSNRKGGRLFWRDRSVGPNDDIDLEKEQKYAIRKVHNDFKTGVPIEFPRNRSRKGLDLASASRPSPFDARTIRQQYLQLRTYNSKASIGTAAYPPQFENWRGSVVLSGLSESSSIREETIGVDFMKPSPRFLRISFLHLIGTTRSAEAKDNEGRPGTAPPDSKTKK
jgi:hypothetical protein